MEYPAKIGRFFAALLLGAFSGADAETLPALAYGYPEQAGWYSQSYFGTSLMYEQLKAPSGEVRSLSIPIILPMEASFGRLYLGSSLEYGMKQFETDTRQYKTEGLSYFSVDGRFVAYQAKRSSLLLSQSLDIPLAHNQKESVPHSAMLNPGSYRIDSSLRYHYSLSRFDLQFDISHRLTMARNGYDPGDVLSAAFAVGYGFGRYENSVSEKHPFDITMGIISRYNFPDRNQKELLLGTEYGTVFFAPGLMLNSRSLIFQANVELPVMRYSRSAETQYQEKMRGNVGVKYYIPD